MCCEKEQFLNKLYECVGDDRQTSEGCLNGLGVLYEAYVRTPPPLKLIYFLGLFFKEVTAAGLYFTLVSFGLELFHLL